MPILHMAEQRDKITCPALIYIRPRAFDSKALKLQSSFGVSYRSQNFRPEGELGDHLVHPLFYKGQIVRLVQGHGPGL